MRDLGFDRVVVILDPGGERRAAVEAAVEMASALRLPLHGIFVEDESYLDLAGLALSSHVALGCQEPGALESGLLAAAIKVEARRSRELFEAVAQRVGVPTTFAEWRGRPNLGNVGVRVTDLVVVEGYSRPLTGQARMRSLWSRRLASADASVLILKHELARNLVIGRIADGETQMRPTQLADMLARHLAGSIVRLQKEEISDAGDETGSRAPAAGKPIPHYADLRCDMVIVEEDEADIGISSALIAKGRCSVLVLRRR
ncbi:hypothetical protein [Dongia sp.]|uniref:hypothetical protein n=1 Tax=Dongia sp. TaxID=1977262 RepID=UPI0035AED4EA